jgi:hypothetical protein
MKRIAIVAGAALAATAIGLPSATAHNAGPRVFKLIEHDRSLSAVDLPPVAASHDAPPSAGDMVVFTKRLTTPSGARAGTLHAVCTVTDPGAAIETSVFACDGRYLLRHGQITASMTGRLDRKVTLAITGGTGVYKRARGEIVNDEGTDTVHLVR